VNPGRITGATSVHSAQAGPLHLGAAPRPWRHRMLRSEAALTEQWTLPSCALRTLLPPAIVVTDHRVCSKPADHLGSAQVSTGDKCSVFNRRRHPATFGDGEVTPSHID